MSYLLHLLHLLSVVLSTAATEQLRESFRFELIHRDQIRRSPAGDITRFPEAQAPPPDGGARTSEMLRRRRASEIPANATAFSLPLGSGMYSRTAQYFVRFHVGTPAQKFLLVADTGSDITWINCHRCRRRCRKPVVNGRPAIRRRIFNASRSSTYRPIPCSSTTCKTLPFSLVRCPTPTTTCAYDYRYADGSETKGFFASESMTLTLSKREKAKFTNIVIGCSSSSIGRSFEEADGVLGLGLSEHSFTGKAIQKFGGKFTYCLVDRFSSKNVSSYLTFGVSLKNKSTLRYTKLVLDPEILPYYAVQVTGISIDSTMMNIPSDVWDVRRNGGVIIDSGTSLTLLAEPAYQVVMAALRKPLNKFQQVEMKPFQFCFNATHGYQESMVPKLAIHFSSSAQFQPPVKSYVVEAGPDVRCIGFLSTRWPGVSVIGNILQQNFLWEFDIRSERLGFQESSCI